MNPAGCSGVDTPDPTLDLAVYRNWIEQLIQERDEATADADRQTAGMREVALFRAANAAALLGHLSLPLLERSEAAEAEVVRLRTEVKTAVALHRRLTGRPDICVHCKHVWPCPTTCALVPLPAAARLVREAPE